MVFRTKQFLLPSSPPMAGNRCWAMRHRCAGHTLREGEDRVFTPEDLQPNAPGVLSCPAQEDEVCVSCISGPLQHVVWDHLLSRLRLCQHCFTSAFSLTINMLWPCGGSHSRATLDQLGAATHSPHGAHQLHWPCVSRSLTPVSSPASLIVLIPESPSLLLSTERIPKLSPCPEPWGLSFAALRATRDCTQGNKNKAFYISQVLECFSLLPALWRPAPGYRGVAQARDRIPDSRPTRLARAPQILPNYAKHS
ncbi:uncharacterized protein LOC111554427 [Piliocolobus tephrosceles]|uniref:uncharacterized protein LOC111554427 n=1 Tax=Piliocolobus tephrosceles TaxID=591936 RepID=UPI000C2AFA17|nr:uncharacterized protein LOC111554427 [Piliocolobus tephrosceles]